MGSHNLLSLLGSNRAELERQILKEKVAATKIQGAYRNYLRGRWARAEVAQRLVVAMLLYRAATLIAALVRGRLGRRRQLTFTALEIVKGAHAKLLKEAVRGDKKIHKRRCFWYRRDQVAVLFKDYLIVAERTGFDPPRTRTLIEVPPTTPIAKKKMLTACVAHKQTNKHTNKQTNKQTNERTSRGAEHPGDRAADPCPRGVPGHVHPVALPRHAGAPLPPDLPSRGRARARDSLRGGAAGEACSHGYPRPTTNNQHTRHP